MVHAALFYSRSLFNLKKKKEFKCDSLVDTTIMVNFQGQEAWYLLVVTQVTTSQ